ncbi:MAG: hypothetical protein NTW94_08985 [Legionellales bacterium]|nr:hypothetical protein [Legionellales bacterium]
MRAKIGFFIFMFLMQTSHDSPAATDSDVYAKALTLMERNQFEAAVYIMTPLAKTNPNTKLLLSLGDAYVALDQPKKALNYYILVYQHANQSDDQLFKRIALYKMARMQFWLGQYVSSGKTYQLLLTYPLSPLEHELALAGLVKSLSYYDRPRRAYRLIPHDMVFTTPEMVVAASQASSWANWSDLTRTILITEMPITNNINSRSPLAKDIQDLQWQTRRATSPGEITPSVFASHDSEDFNKTRVMLDYTRYWNQLAQTAVGLDSRTNPAPDARFNFKRTN